MPDRDEPNLVVVQCCEHGVDFGAGEPKHELYAFIGEAACEKLASGDFSHDLPPSFWTFPYRLLLIAGGL
jgi:hypothetical protein